MLGLTAETRVFVKTGATDLRLAFEGLRALVVNVVRQDPTSGCVFAFCNKSRNRVRCLYWDGSGTNTLIAEASDGLWSVGLFRCESILLKSFWVMVVMDVFTRRIVGFGVEPAHIDGISVCRMFNPTWRGQPLPKRLSSDHDPLFRFHRWRANLRILDIEEIKPVPFAPCSHPFVERLIETLRREYLHQIFFWNGLDLHRKLDLFAAYYNQRRVHAGLSGQTPFEQCHTTACPPANLHHFAWRSDCSGLFHIPIAA